MSAFRVYFYNRETGKELKDHPLNGKSWLGTSGNVYRNGEFVRGTCTSVTVADFSNLYRIVGEREVTANDFDCPVRIKIWSPSGDHDYRDLLRD